MTANPHTFRKQLISTCLQIYRSQVRLHERLFVSVPKRMLRERCRTGVQYVTKFRVLPGDLSFVLTNFLWLNETLGKIALCSDKLSLDMPWHFMQTLERAFVEKSREQRTKFAHFACITFAQYCRYWVFWVHLNSHAQCPDKVFAQLSLLLVFS